MSKHFLLYGLVGLVFAGFLFSRSKASGLDGKSGVLAAPAMTPDGFLDVGAVRLWKDYADNEVAADARYKGQRLRVTGTLTSIERDYDGRPVLHLFSGNPIFQTMATLNKADLPAAARLRKGDQVVVRCIGAGVEMRMPQLERCLLL